MNESIMAGSASQSAPPRVWLLLGPKAGDNNQILSLAEALGWSYEVRNLRYHSYELLTNRLLQVTLAGVDHEHSDQLQAPWPDLIITAGRRNEPVARWIRKQSQGKVRIVHLGRPWAPLDVFDLIVTTPQYFLPDRSNVLKVDLPLHRVYPQRLQEARKVWQSRFESLPRPLIAVLFGGDSGKFVFTPGKGRSLGRLVNRMALERGASVLITNSARTPAAAFEACLEELQVPTQVFRWGDKGDNPYFGYLACADQFVVTGESISMITEAYATGKPLYLFDPGDPPDCSWWRSWHNFRIKPLTHRLGMWLGPERMRRDISQIQTVLVQNGGAAWLGERQKEKNGPGVGNYARLAAERVRALFVQAP